MNNKLRGRVDSQMTMVGDIGSTYGGTVIAHPVTLDEALNLGGLNWEVGLREICMADKNRTRIPGHYATFRKDTNVPLGIVRGRYTPVQNKDAFDWLRGVIGHDGAVVTSAGVLYGGRYSWVCLDLGGFEVVPEDEVRKHLLVMNSHDGSSNMLVQNLPGRIACQNVLNFHTGGGGSDAFKIRHTGTAKTRLGEIQQVMAVAASRFQEVQEAFTLFKDVKLTPEASTDLIFASLGVPQQEREDWNAGELEKQPQWVNQVTTINDLVTRGPGSDIPGVRGTVWGTFNAVNGYFDHIRTVRGAEKNPDTAIESKLTGYSAKAKVKAFEVCFETAKSLRN